MEGSGFRVQGSGCRVQGSGFRVQGAGCRGTRSYRDAWSCRRILMTSSGATVHRVRPPATVPAAPCFHSAILAPAHSPPRNGEQRRFRWSLSRDRDRERPATERRDGQPRPASAPRQHKPEAPTLSHHAPPAAALRATQVPLVSISSSSRCTQAGHNTCSGVLWGRDRCVPSMVDQMSPWPWWKPRGKS